MNRHLRVVFGFLVTVLLLYLAVRDVDLGQVAQTLTRANLALALPALLCTSCGYIIRARRWQSILAPTKRIPFPTLFSTLILGFAANNVLPARVGELIRAHQIGRKAGISRGLGLSTIVVERVFDGLTLIVFMGLVVAFFPVRSDQPEVRAVELFAPIVFVGAAIAMIVVLFNEALAMRLVEVLVKPLPGPIAERSEGLAASVIHGLRALQSRRHLTAILLFSVLVWSAEAASYYLVLFALDVPLAEAQRVSAALFLVVFVNLGIMIPSAPGYVGTFQLFAKMALGAFGVNPVLGFSVAVLAHALQYALVTGLGLVFFAREHLTVNQLTAPLPAVRAESRLGEPTPE